MLQYKTLPNSSVFASASPQLSEVFGVESFTHQYTGANTQTGNFQNHQIHHRPGNAFCGQRTFTDKTSGDDRIVSSKIKTTADCTGSLLLCVS